MRVDDIRPVSDEMVRLTEPGHQYVVGEGLTERSAPSLSRVLSGAGLATDYGTVDPAYLAFRARVGTYTHEWIEAALGGGGEPAGGDPFDILHAQPHIDAFCSWREKHDMEVAYSETPAYQPYDAYACTADFVGLLDGKPAVIDWKTTSRISKTVALQTMGQARCFEGVAPYDVVPFERYALHLTKKGTARLVRFLDYATDSATLVAAAACWKARSRYV